MLNCKVSSEFAEVVFTARLAFSKRSWPYVLATAVPAILCSGQRCITRLAELGSHPRSLSSYYRFLSHGKWRLDVLFKSLFNLIVATFGVVDLILVVDDTLCPKWGRGIFGTSSHFDHVRRPRPGYIWGHNWVVLAVVVQIREYAWVALPFWIRLYRSKKICDPEEFKTKLEMTLEGLTAVRAWFSGKITLLADGAYNSGSLVPQAVDLRITVVSRLRVDARLRRPAPKRAKKSKRGRRPTRGNWLPGLRAMAKNRRSFRTQRVHIYGKTVRLRIREFVAYWPATKMLIKVVITQDPKNPKRTAVLSSTDIQMSALEIIELFARRWTIEQLFATSKNQLGLDSAEVRKEGSVLRHAALTMAIVTWIEAWARRHRPRLSAMTFTKKIAAIRESTVMETIFASGPRTRRSRRIAEGVASLFTAATAAC